MLSPAISALACANGFRVRDFAFHAVEGRRLRAIAHSQARVAGLAHGARAAMLRDQQIGLGLRFGQLLLQLPQGGFQIFHLRLLVALPVA